MSEFDKITPDTYKKMNEEFIEEGAAFSIKVPTQREIDQWKLKSQSPQTFKRPPEVDLVAQMWEEHRKTMTDNNVREENEEKWRKATNKNIVDNLVEKIEELLDGKAHHYYVSDRTTKHEKIVIEYNYQKKDD